jgi:selenide,water dikinase
VDDAEDFGRIASVNAISDVYAMGGTPVLAIAILGWPIGQLSPEVANQVVNGSHRVCEEAGIPLAGGHSIDSPEPIFGLAVTGRVAIENLKRNGGATEGCSLFLTKPLGVGILSTAQKKGLLQPAHQNLARTSMLQLNKIGELFGRMNSVKAMTDVTGFGLLGHLCEMCEASGMSASIDFSKVPLLDKEALDGYLSGNCIPGGTNRNWDSYGHKIGPLTEYQKQILCDPQTSGGLLVAVEEGEEAEFLSITANEGLQLKPIGRMVKQERKLVSIH